MVDNKFSFVDTGYGLSSGSPYGSSSPVIGSTSTTAQSVSNNSEQKSLLDYFTSLNALDYDRSIAMMRENNAFNAEQAQINRIFQENMSNTAYQRQAEDLKKAGYNPALVLGSGGASSPSGSVASGNNISVPQLASMLSSTFSSIYNTAKTTATTERGQDITASTAKRGQDMQLIGDIIRSVGSIIGDLLPNKIIKTIKK